MVEELNSVGSCRIIPRKELGGAKKTSCVMCDCYKSVARIRLAKTENPSAYVDVNCKVCTIAIAL
jgi:hypothetical protein